MRRLSSPPYRNIDKTPNGSAVDALLEVDEPTPAAWAPLSSWPKRKWEKKTREVTRCFP